MPVISRSTVAAAMGCMYRREAAIIPPPQVLYRGNLALSTRRTFAPVAAAVRAALEPAGPAPTTTTSQSGRSVPSLMKAKLNCVFSPLLGEANGDLSLTRQSKPYGLAYLPADGPAYNLGSVRSRIEPPKGVPVRIGNYHADSRKVVRALGRPDSLGLTDMLAFVEDHRGTKIHFEETDTLDGTRVCGAWTGDGRGNDYIYLPASARSEVKLATCCHELGHMLSEPVNVGSLPQPIPEIEDFLAGVINPARRVAYAFARSTFSDEREAAAEALGDQLALRILRAQRRSANRDHQFDRVFA